MGKLQHNFASAAKDYGLKRIFLSVSFIGGVLLVVGFTLILTQRSDLPQDFLKEVSAQVQTVAVGVFAILFAGFAIVISLSDEGFVKFLQREKVFVRLLFPFWFDSALYLLAIFLSFLSGWFNGPSQKVLVSFSVWFVLWALIDTFYLIMSTVMFGYYRADYIEYKEEIQATLNERDAQQPK